MTRTKRKELLAIGIVDLAMLIYMIIDLSLEPLECECERFTLEDWLFLAPLLFLFFGIVLTIAYYLMKILVINLSYLYENFYSIIKKL